MLPFLKHHQEASDSSPIQHQLRQPDDEDHESMTLVVEELIHAIHNRDVPGAKAALQAAFQIFDSEPHEEGPHG